MEKKAVLVVDDSAFMRRMITDIVEEDPRLYVAATARNGEDALKKVREYDPDVVTMDIEMPKMDGITALHHIMEESPRPVVMLSSLTQEGAEATIRALSVGAVDFIPKPSGSISLDITKAKKTIVQKVLAASRANIKKEGDTFRDERIPASPPRVRGKSLIAIGTSTGGPRALQEVVTSLPASFQSPLLIVQHMPPGFTKSLAERLDRLSEIRVKEAEDGEEILPGTAYIAPGGYHMGVNREKQGYIELNKKEPVFGHRPSVNHLFESLVPLSSYRIVTVVMTGMGADGTEGMITLKRSLPDVHTIAEARESCVVYGMPKSLVAAGLADEVVPLPEIAKRIHETVNRF